MTICPTCGTDPATAHPLLRQCADCRCLVCGRTTGHVDGVFRDYALAPGEPSVRNRLCSGCVAAWEQRATTATAVQLELFREVA